MNDPRPPQIPVPLTAAQAEVFGRVAEAPGPTGTFWVTSKERRRRVPDLLYELNRLGLVYPVGGGSKRGWKLTPLGWGRWTWALGQDASRRG